jgi:hypothetical protein
VISGSREWPAEEADVLAAYQLFRQKVTSQSPARNQECKAERRSLEKQTENINSRLMAGDSHAAPRLWVGERLEVSDCFMKIFNRTMQEIGSGRWLLAWGFCLGLIPLIARYFMRVSQTDNLALAICFLSNPVFMIAGGIAVGARLAHEKVLVSSVHEVSGFSPWARIALGGFLVTLLSSLLTIAPSSFAGKGVWILPSRDLQSFIFLWMCFALPFFWLALEVGMISSFSARWLRRDGAAILFLYCIVLFVFVRASEVRTIPALLWGIPLLSGIVAVMLGCSLLINQISLCRIKWVWLMAILAIGLDLAITERRLFVKSGYTIFLTSFNLMELISEHPFWFSNVLLNGAGTAAIIAATFAGLSFGRGDGQKVLRYMSFVLWLILLPALVWMDIHSRLLTAWPISNHR